MDFEGIFSKYVNTQLRGRYITNKHIEPILNDLKNDFEIGVAGHSVLNKPIYSIKTGTGSTRVFIWSQMHGNESTTTKAVFDFLNFLKSDDELAKSFKQHFTYYILPIVNPDGAELYTRANANEVDLNRDSVNLSQPEAKVLRGAFDSFKPHFAYNMHDQRTIFGLGDDNPKPATVSFLAPSYNEEREVNEPRQTAINVIAAMNETLQEFIPGQVGRFDDGFNINCIGDMFQSIGVPTILFEAGHYQNDYLREKTRKFVFFAILSGFNAIYENVIVVNKREDYFRIPQNKVIFFDFMYKNVKINYENKEIITNFASHYKEVLIDNSVIFEAFIKEIGDSGNFYGHEEYDCQQELFTGEGGSHLPKSEEKADFIIGKNREFVNGLEKK
ncbi:peptidase M14 [Flavobacterium alkalisoli]|uniref:Peptidase M14 n=1 Tax=Flavobacterium alkalisoli TaxID=2602769 RepID=A0A5B9FV20_9FLAO|nr:M14 metallopeptidase family protein [Flavobacterium alkalisoli]QEE50764.1 peptidase M14 [Flavobacterium alkalisoli]